MAEFSLLNLEVSSLLSLEHLRPWRKFWSQGQLTTAEDHKHIILEKWLLVSGLDFNFYIELRNVANCNWISIFNPFEYSFDSKSTKVILKDRKYLLFLVSKSSYQVGTKTFCACHTHELRIVLSTIRKSVIPLYHLTGKSKQPDKV